MRPAGSDRLSDLTDAELIQTAVAARRQTSWAQARELAAIAELHQRRCRDDRQDDEKDPWVLSGHESVVEEVASALTVTGNAAATLVHLAHRLGTDLADTHRALEAGHIDLPRARVICDLTDNLPDGVAERAERAVLNDAPSRTTGQLRQRIKRLVRRLAPEGFEDRRQRATQERRLELWETASGTADLALLDLAAEDAHAIHNKITAVAHALIRDGDSRSLDLLRADLAKELLHGTRLPDAVTAVLAAGADQDPPTASPAPDIPDDGTPGSVSSGSDTATASGDGGPEVGSAAQQAVITVLAALVDRRLTAVRDHARATGRLGMLRSMSVSAVQDLRDGLAEVRESWCQDAGSASGEHGRPGYRPPAAMRRRIEVRHATCVFPTCNIRSSRCDLDHTVPYGDGITCACNLAPLCRRHHRAKQTSSWRLVQLWSGLLVWITPSGSWHVVRPNGQ